MGRESILLANYTRMENRLASLRLEERELESKMELVAVEYRRKSGYGIRIGK